jgi:hypothetical protein
MKFTIRVRERDTKREWDEPYEKDEVTDEESAREWAEETIESFNNTLRPYEKPRDLIRVTVEEGTESNLKDHDWEKTNMTTVRSGRLLSYDAYRCRRCRITAKRSGFHSPIVNDRKFKAQIYQRCDTSLAHRKKRGDI